LQKRALTTNTFSLIPETEKSSNFETNKETGKVSQNQAKKRTKVLTTKFSQNYKIFSKFATIILSYSYSPQVQNYSYNCYFKIM
jgi:hypothetical protein